MAWTCVFSKQSLQPGLCGLSQLQEQVLSPAGAPLLPKLRGHFAEFLNHGSLDRLGILYLTTCVGLGYGPRCHSLEAFLGSIGSLTSPNRLGIGSQACETRICLRLALHPYPGTTIARVGLPSCVTPSLAYYRFGSRAPPFPPKGSWLWALSITGLGIGATSPVREYQPVVHRLRLSASP